jgi:hypothetical protein
LATGMTVVAEYQAAQPSRLQEIMHLLRRNEDHVVIAGLFLVIAATSGIALLANVAAGSSSEIGVCVQHTHLLPAHFLLSMH